MSEAPDLKVVTLYERTLQDIPAMLRHTADRIEAGELGDVKSMVSVLLHADESVTVMGFGDNPSSHHAVGVMHCGIAQLTNHVASR